MRAALAFADRVLLTPLPRAGPGKPLFGRRRVREPGRGRPRPGQTVLRRPHGFRSPFLSPVAGVPAFFGADDFDPDSDACGLMPVHRRDLRR
ncbi:MAG TPA: hypothetical protein VE546_04345 [Streptomyces sp.]|uniref:hypothetical protein n=1 Tax=Streptomyces sp. TaxID=1931 RepID=UPI002D3F4295|nr:hypothetical protein [Streptomyces sp.]HZG02793.1 hypothetical protein [Streptomyces sp.]